MALQNSGSHDRETLVASTSYSRTVTISSGANRKFFAGVAAGRFYIDNQTAVTLNGVAGTLVNSTTSSPAVRVHVWQWDAPSSGSQTLAVSNTTNTNEGAWFWADFDDCSGTVTSAVDESSSDTNANPAATVGATDIAFMVVGGLAASTGGTTATATIRTHNLCIVTGTAPNRTFSSATQLAAVTAVIPQSAGGGASVPVNVVTPNQGVAFNSAARRFC